MIALDCLWGDTERLGRSKLAGKWFEGGSGSNWPFLRDRDGSVPPGVSFPVPDGGTRRLFALERENTSNRGVLERRFRTALPARAHRFIVHDFESQRPHRYRLQAVAA